MRDFGPIARFHQCRLYRERQEAVSVLTKRIIACLDCDAGRVVKGVKFVNIRDAGDPAELAALARRQWCG